MSEKTAGYAVKHHDLGKKDLWNTPGLRLPAYIQNIAAALIRDGMGKSRAIATAVATCKRWAVGGGNVSPEVRAAARKAVTEWELAKAKARATPGRADLSALTEAPLDLAWDEAAHPRVASGAGGGQFTTKSGGKGGEKKKNAKTRAELYAELLSKKGQSYRDAPSGAAAGSKGGKQKATSKQEVKTGGGSSSKLQKSSTSSHAGAGSKGFAKTSIPGKQGFSKASVNPAQAKAKAKLTRAKAAEVRKKLLANRRELRAHAAQQGWKKTKGDWYVTQELRGGQLLVVGIRQDGMGFAVSRGGEVKRFTNFGAAAAWAAA